MISSELLRFYPFFGILNDQQQKTVAMLSEEISLADGAELFKKGENANFLYLLLDGTIDLYDITTSENDPTYYKEYLVNEIHPGEILALAALIEPYILSLSAKASSPSRLIKIDAIELRKICETDLQFAYILTQQAAKLALKRLEITRSLLAVMMS